MPPTFAIRVEDSSLPTAAHRIHDGTTVFREACLEGAHTDSP